MGKKIRPRRWMIVVGVLLLFLFPSFIHIQQLRERRRELQAEIGRLKAQNAEMALQMKLLQEDPLYIERVARKKLGVAREGEVIFRFRDE